MSLLLISNFYTLAHSFLFVKNFFVLFSDLNCFTAVPCNADYLNTLSFDCQHLFLKFFILFKLFIQFTVLTHNSSSFDQKYYFYEQNSRTFCVSRQVREFCLFSFCSCFLHDHTIRKMNAFPETAVCKSQLPSIFLYLIFAADRVGSILRTAIPANHFLLYLHSPHLHPTRTRILLHQNDFLHRIFDGKNP